MLSGNWEQLARQSTDALLKCEQRERETRAEISEMSGVLRRVEGLLERHLLEHAKVNGGLGRDGLGKDRELPSLGDLEIITEHGTRRSPATYEEWERNQAAATWTGVKKWSAGVAKIVVGGVLLVAVTAIITVLLHNWALGGMK
jgi:hypothetical protein